MHKQKEFEGSTGRIRRMRVWRWGRASSGKSKKTFGLLIRRCLRRRDIRSINGSMGAGTPRQWKDLEGARFLLFIYYLLVGKIAIGSPEAESQYLVRNRSQNHEARLAARRGWSCRKLATSTPGC